MDLSLEFGLCSCSTHLEIDLFSCGDRMMSSTEFHQGGTPEPQFDIDVTTPTADATLTTASSIGI